MNRLHHKLALGSVQFGISYGISNSGGQTKPKEVSDILKIALDNGIDTLDTAKGYGESEQILGTNDLSSWKVITKFADIHSNEKLGPILNDSLTLLNKSKIYALLAHNSSFLIKHPDRWDELQELKANNLIEKAGVSLYDTADLEKLLKLSIVPDIIQCPFNIIDHRFEPYFEELKNLNVEIHTRSVFLQGLFFMDPVNINSYFLELIPLLTALNQQLLTKKNIAGYLLQHCLSQDKIDKVVIGVNTADQLITNIDAAQSRYEDLNYDLNSFSSLQIINPSLWPKKMN